MVRFLLSVFCLISLVGSARAEFRFRLNEDLGTLDWGYGEVNGPVVQQLMEGLTISGPRGEPVAALAKSWRKVGSHGLEFTLRNGARWSDGEPVCAKHFTDAWLRALDPSFGSPYAHYFFDIKNAKRFHLSEEKDTAKVGLRAVGCHKLVVELERPVAFFPALVSHWVFNPIRLDLLAKHGKSWTEPANLAVTGPYKLAEWKRDQKYVLKRNPLYYGSAAHEESLVAMIVANDGTARDLFEQGMLDWVRDLPFLDKAELSKRPDYRLFPSYVSYHLGFRHAPGSSLTREERCALSQALDKAKIPRVLKGGERPADSVAPPLLTSLNRAATFNATAARKLLGAPRAKSLQLYYYAKDIHQPLMELIQEQWRKNLGVNVELVKMEGKTYWSRLQKDPPQIFLSGTTAAYAHPYSFYSEFLSESHANWGRYTSKTFDDAALATAAQSGLALSKSAARAERQILDTDCAVIPLYFRQTAALVSARWEGFDLNPMTYVYLKTIKRKR